MSKVGEDRELPSSGERYHPYVSEVAGIDLAQFVIARAKASYEAMSASTTVALSWTEPSNREDASWTPRIRYHDIP